MSAPIFYISTEEYDALTPGATCALSGSEASTPSSSALSLANASTWVTAPAAAHSVRSPPLMRTAVSVQVQSYDEERSVPSIYLVQALAEGRPRPARH